MTLKDMQWDDGKVGRIMYALFVSHRQRDLQCALWNALLYRRKEFDSAQIGVHIPSPFDESKLIIPHITGALASTAQRWMSEITDNPPRTIVEPMVEGDRQITAKMHLDATMQEHFHNGVWHLSGGRTLQRRMGWNQVIEGAGWYLCHEYEAGFGLPDRLYYELDEITSEQAEADETVSDIPRRRPDGSFAWAEKPDLYEARARNAMKEQARNARSLFQMEQYPDSQVYAERDRKGWKIAAIVSHVDATDFGAGSEMAQMASSFRESAELLDRGVILDKQGRIAGGVAEGGPGDGSTTASTSSTRDKYILCRIFTREEIYYFVTKSFNYEGGALLWGTKHNYGEVPLWPVPFTDTGSERPHERFLPALAGAYASVPGYNQVLTLLSQNITWNAIPRFVIMLPEGGGLLTDPRTGNPRILTSESTVGLDPDTMEVLQNGATIQQLTIEGAADLLRLLEVYQANLSDALPSEAAKGTGGTSGPAWTTTLLQLAQRVVLAPGVEFHAAALEQIMRFQARTTRALPMPVYFLASMGKRGKADGARLVELKGDKVSLNLSVNQSANSREEQLTALEIGRNLLNNPTGPLIDLWEFFEDYMGANNPHESVLRVHLQTMLNAMVGTVELPEGSLLQLIMDITAGQVPIRLAEELPQVGRALAAESLARGGGAQTPGGGGITRAAGIAAPGVNAPLTLEGTGTRPGGLPSQGYEQQAQNLPTSGAPAL